MNFMKLILIAFLTFGLSACAAWDKTWDWVFEDSMFDDGDEQVAMEDEEEYYEDEEEYYEDEDEYYEDEEGFYEDEEEMMQRDRRRSMRDRRMSDRMDEDYDEYEDEYGDEEEMMDREMRADKRSRGRMDRMDRMDRMERMERQRGQQGRVPRKTVVYFDYKQKGVPASGMNLLQMHARYLLQNPDRVLAVEGHTDSVASPEYNRRLGMQRARSVAEILMQMGVARDQLETRSFGQERPLQEGDSESAHALNRRVELIYR